MVSKRVALTNRQFESVCYHPTVSVHNHGDCLAAKLRSGNLDSDEDWDELLLPEIEPPNRRRERRFVFLGRTRPFAKPEIYERLEECCVMYAIRIPAN